MSFKESRWILPSIRSVLGTDVSGNIQNLTRRELYKGSSSPTEKQIVINKSPRQMTVNVEDLSQIDACIKEAVRNEKLPQLVLHIEVGGKTIAHNFEIGDSEKILTTALTDPAALGETLFAYEKMLRNPSLPTLIDAKNERVDVFPVGYEELLVRLKEYDSQHNTSYAEMYPRVARVIENQAANISLTPFKTKRASMNPANNDGPEQEVVIPSNKVSALKVAHELGLISSEQFAKARQNLKEGKGKIHTIAFVQGYRGTGKETPYDEIRTNQWVLEGLVKIAEAVKRIDQGEEDIDIPETDVHVISPMHTIGIPPSVKVGGEFLKNYTAVESLIIRDFLLEQGIFSEDGKPNQIVTIGGFSMGGLVACGIAYSLSNFWKRVFLYHPVGFDRSWNGTLYPIGMKAVLDMGVATDRNDEPYTQYDHIARTQAVASFSGIDRGIIDFTLEEEKRKEWAGFVRSSLRRSDIEYKEPANSEVVVSLSRQDQLMFPTRSDVESSLIGRLFAGQRAPDDSLDPIHSAIEGQFRGSHTTVVHDDKVHSTPRFNTGDIQRIVKDLDVLSALPLRHTRPNLEGPTKLSVCLGGKVLFAAELA